MKPSLLIAGLAGLLVGGSAVALATGQIGTADSDRARVERIVRNYILEHPEILPEAMQKLQERETAKVVDNNRAAFETPYGNAWAGAEKADVVLVEFFDYACAYCRQMNPAVERLLAEDKNLKVVWREYPVLGENSIAASYASLAAAQQGKFREFHGQLFKSARPTPETVAAAQKAAGLGRTAVTEEMRSELDKNYQLAGAIRGTGTPLFVVGDQVLHGAVGYDILKQAVAKARAS